MTIHEILQRLRDQDGAMLGGKSAKSLLTFLLGFSIATDDFTFLNEFNHYVRDRFDHKIGTQGWEKIITFRSVNEDEEWKLFWSLYDQLNKKF